MFNPLIDVTQYTDIQLESKIIELQRKYFQSHNPQLKQQIAVSMDTFKTELYARRAAAAKKQQENGGNDLDSLINIS
jgi:hypothetical protein